MINKSKYLKYCTKRNNILNGGYTVQTRQFYTGDKFITRYKNIGTIIRLANINEFNLNLHYANIYYVVSFDEGNYKLYQDVYCVTNIFSGGYDYVVEEKDIRHTSGYNTINVQGFNSPTNIFQPIQKCRFNLGETVYFKDGLIRNKQTPLQQTRLSNLVGIITNILHIPTMNTCVYHVLFNTGFHGIEITENMLQKIPNSLNSSISTYSPIYQNLNPSYQIDDSDDKQKLFKKIGKYYQRNIIIIIEKDELYKDLKKEIPYIESKRGLKYILKILKKYSKKNGIKWHKLKNDKYIDNIKKYILVKLQNQKF
jgi:hypothetical protein